MVKVTLHARAPLLAHSPAANSGGESSAAGSPPWGGRGPSPERGKVPRHTQQALGRCGRLSWSYALPTAWGGAEPRRIGWGRPAL